MGDGRTAVGIECHVRQGRDETEFIVDCLHTKPRISGLQRNSFSHVM